ncbi:MAG: FAD-dependent thymidylate synthase [Nitrospira sp.]
MPPEKCAYALARYSRSPDSIEDSIRWVHTHSSEKFWEQFYFDYGHASIADLGHVVICFEGVSELAAIRLEDEPLWDGQAKSSRYQNFSTTNWFVPPHTRGSRSEATYHRILHSLSEAYRLLHDPLVVYLSERHPRPPTMMEADYWRRIKARAFDVTRYLLPLAATTNVGQVVSIRTLEKQITRLLSSHLSELRTIGEDLRNACARPPANLWNELCGTQEGASEPLAPTLARHARANPYYMTVYSDLARQAKEILHAEGLDQPHRWTVHESVDLIEPHDLVDEIVTTLLYSVSHAPYRDLLALVQSWSEKQKREMIEIGIKQRGTHDELIKEFRSGYAVIFDILMDIGAWRDLHRHRRCQQVQQSFTTLHGYDVPPPLIEAGLEREYRQTMDTVYDAIEQLKQQDQEAALYAIPFGFRVRCLFKMDFAEAEYIAKLRSGVKGHWSYRTVAWSMKQKLAARYPLVGEKIQTTPPDVEDTLNR